MPKFIEAREICDSRLEKPFRLIIGGASGSGKTSFLKKLVDSSHFGSPFDKIVYFYPEYLPDIPIEFDQIVEYRTGIADLDYFSSLPKNTLIIFDDLMNECGSSTDIMKLFSVIARKRELSIAFIVQNMFDQTKQFRNLKLNATGFIIFKFHAAMDVLRRHLRNLGVAYLISKQALDQLYKTRYNYIFIDIHPNRHSNFDCIRSNILSKNFSIFHKMEYVAIPKADFVKYFTILEAKDGTVRAIKNEIEVGKTSKRKRKYRKSPDIVRSTSRKKRSRYSTPESLSESTND